MIKFIKNYFEFTDDRGSIKGLVNFGKWEEVNIIESDANIVRGNHYHKKMKELFIILNGKINIKLQRVSCGNLQGAVERYEVKKGDVFLIDKNINHIFEIVEPSCWINVLSKKTNSLNPDILSACSKNKV